MFSRKERAYLESVVSARRQGIDPGKLLRARFPNPSYRRKLLWSIRTKMGRAIADWELLTSAIGSDPRILSSWHQLGEVDVPFYVDPLLAALQGFSRVFDPLRARGKAAEDLPLEESVERRS